MTFYAIFHCDDAGDELTMAVETDEQKALSHGVTRMLMLGLTTGKIIKRTTEDEAALELKARVDSFFTENYPDLETDSDAEPPQTVH